MNFVDYNQTLSFNNVCRVCLKYDETTTTNIFNATELLDMKCIANTIMECAPVNIYYGDGKPSLICYSCLSLLQNANQFRTLCLKSEGVLWQQQNNSYNYTSLNPLEKSTQENCVKKEVDDSSSLYYSEANTYFKPTECDTSIVKKDDQDVEKVTANNFINVKQEINSDEDSNDNRSKDVTATAEQDSERQSLICTACKKTFDALDPEAFRLHEKSHNRLRPYACDRCDKRFETNSKLTRHERTHTGEQPFACTSCDARFSLKCNLQRHERTHTGERPYKCRACDKRFTILSNMQRHERSHGHDRIDTAEPK